MDVTKRFAEFVVDTRIDRAPAEARRLAGVAMLDGLGVAIAATVEPPGQMIVEYVREQGGNPRASVIGGGFKTSTANAAYANGTLAHCLDFDDVGGFGHPTVVLLPAILAVAEKLGKSGRDAVEAYVTGFEVAANLAQGNTRGGGKLDQVHGFHSTAVYGHFAAAAATAKLLGLDVEQTQRAFGIVASSCAGILANLGYHVKPLHAGQACRNGVVAAELAARGWTGAPDIIERPVGWAYAFFGDQFDPTKATAGLGALSRLPEVLGIKKYPCCYYNHAAIDALLGLLHDNDIAFEDVASAELEVPALLPFFHPRPVTGFQGKFSYEYNLAAAILDHEIVQESFSDAKATSPGMVAALNRSRVVERPEKFDSSTHRPARVMVRTAAGREIIRVVEMPSGGAADPLTREQIAAKFRLNAARLLTNADVERVLDMMENFENTTVADIMEIVGAPALVRA